jgi:hypothetical protein
VIKSNQRTDTMRQVVTGGVIAAAGLVIGVGLYLVLRSDQPAPGPVLEPITGPERAQDARELLDQLGSTDVVDFDTTFESAQAFQSDGQLADAQLLLFAAARNDHGPSAFALATMNDPNHHSPETSLLPDADAFQAYRWYTVAHEQGVA